MGLISWSRAGLAKTVQLMALKLKALRRFHRVQFNAPDLFRRFDRYTPFTRQDNGQFLYFNKGPLFAYLVLADENKPSAPA